MKPLAVDLCCGMGGWTAGLQAAGWDTIGFDVVAMPEYRWPLVLQDVRTMDGRRLRSASLIVASPPCTEFSKLDKPRSWFPDAGEPSMELVDACRRIAVEAECPMVLENVRGARAYLGREAVRYGSWWLWGDGVPLLIPWTRIGGKNWRGRSNWDKRGSERRACIPFDLARWVGEYHLNGSMHPVQPAPEGD